MEISLETVLGLAAFGLLVAVSGGVLYLTTAEWRDRRRQEREKQEQRAKRPRVKASRR